MLVKYKTRFCLCIVCGFMLVVKHGMKSMGFLSDIFIVCLESLNLAKFTHLRQLRQVRQVYNSKNVGRNIPTVICDIKDCSGGILREDLELFNKLSTCLFIEH